MVNQYDNGLLALPKELLIKIRSSLDCLQDHVNFSLTCSHLFRMYSRKYWQFACLSAGWGIRVLSDATANKIRHRSKKYKRYRTWPWGGMARMVVQDSRFFSEMDDPKLKDLDAVSAIFESDRFHHSLWTARTIEELDKPSPEIEWAPTHHIRDDAGFADDCWVISGLVDNWGSILPEELLMEYPYMANRLIGNPSLLQVVVHDALADAYDAGSSDEELGSECGCDDCCQIELFATYNYYDSPNPTTSIDDIETLAVIPLLCNAMETSQEKEDESASSSFSDQVSDGYFTVYNTKGVTLGDLYRRFGQHMDSVNEAGLYLYVGARDRHFAGFYHSAGQVYAEWFFD